MTDRLTIGVVAQRTGVPADTIRFYESEGVVPPPARTASGYRAYTPTDVRRLRLVRRARLLGLSLPDVRELVQQAFASECTEFVGQLLERIATQRADTRRRIAELEALHAELDDLERHVRHAQGYLSAGQRVADCDFCPLIDEEDQATMIGQNVSDEEDVLICEYEKRPKGAPSFIDLHDAITAVVREHGALRVEFQPAQRAAVEELTAAERLCCPTIGFELCPPPDVTLTIRATPGKLTTLEQMLTIKLE